MVYLLKASAVVLLFYLCYNLFLKTETFFQHNRWFLFLGLTTALVFPLIVIPIEIIIEPIAIPETSFYINDFSNSVVSPSETAFQWQDGLSPLYAAGLIVFLTQFILQFGSLILLLFKNPKTKDGIYTFIIVKSNVSPFSFFKWIVYNPELFTDKELQLILSHEKVHVRQLHSIDILLTRLACVVFWFNPIIWFYKKDIEQNLEYIADFKTQNETVHDKQYQHLLVKTSITNQQLSIPTNFYNSLIKKRIIMLNKSRSERKNRWKFLLILPFLTILLLSTNTKEVYVEGPQKLIESSPLQLENKTLMDTTEIQTSLPTPKNKSETVEIIFNKSSSDSYLNDIKSQLKDKGVDMDIKTLERNSRGDIETISITFTTKTGNANYNVTEPNGIKPFVFSMKDNGSFGVGPVESNSFFYEDDDENTNTTIVIGSKNQNIKEDNYKMYFIREDNKSDTVYFNGNTNIKTKGNNTFIIADTIKFKKELEKSYWIKKNEKKDLNAIENDHVKIISRSSDSEPIYIINGKEIDKKELNKVNPNTIESINVIKDGKAIETYGVKGKNGVIVIKLKDSNTFTITSSPSGETAIIETPNIDKYLFLLDGKEISKLDLEKVYSKESTISMVILNKKEGLAKYGEKGKNGVVIVKSKNTDNNDNTIIEIKEQNPWKISTAVSSIHYIDDQDSAKNALYFYVTKTTSDAELNKMKTQLKSEGISTKISKLRRNNSGEITSIKIALSDDSGSKASATWRDDNETIPKILVGKKDGKLRVSSSL